MVWVWVSSWGFVDLDFVLVVWVWCVVLGVLCLILVVILLLDLVILVEWLFWFGWVVCFACLFIYRLSLSLGFSVEFGLWFLGVFV